ncbi:MAG: hypothetical protein AAFV59_06940 [Pseudomonadota bacterium]
MSDEAPNMAAALNEQDIVDLTQRPSDAYNEVVLQADYTTRAALSFYRFRQLGGDYRVKNEKYTAYKKRQAEKRKAKETERDRLENEASTMGGPESRPEQTRKLKLGESTGRGVHYVSSHPKVPMLQLSIIALMIIFESAANAYFFAKQSEFGLAGGIFQAAAVSLANVATAFFIVGYWGMRHISMPIDRTAFFSRRNAYIFMGAVASVVGLGLVFLVNLSAAHYRNILDITAIDGISRFPDGLPTNSWSPFFLINKDVCAGILNSDLGSTIGSAATNAMCRPFALHSLDAMVLLALGLAIAAFAAFEGRRLDSPFPGFSDSARGLESARNDLRDALYDFEDSYDDIKDMVLEVKFGEDGMDGKDLSPQEKMIIHRTMRDMMVPYVKLLRTTSDGLSDEFGLEHDIIDQFKVKMGQ